MNLPDLSWLKERTLKAKHSREAHKLIGVVRKLTYYLYAQTLDGIEHERFGSIRALEKSVVSVRIRFFNVRFEAGRVVVETICRYNAKHIYCFSYKDKAEEEMLYLAVVRAVETMSLEMRQVNRYGSHRFIEIFKTQEKAGL